MNLTDFQKKIAWGVGILSIISLWIAFPFIFKLLIEAYKFPKDFTNFGAFGDIYGSLNTLISSIALCAVAFSTWLQVTSLRETREINAKQLTLAKLAHDEQVKESRNAIFANKFYSLLNFKKDKLNSVVLDRFITEENGIPEFEQVSALKVMDELAFRFHGILEKNNNEFSKLSSEELEERFDKIIADLGYDSYSLLISYFLIYIDLCNLIRNSNLEKQDQDFYKSVLSNSMFQHEQLILFWITPIFNVIELHDTEIFTMFGNVEIFKNYAIEFHKISHFRYEEWKCVFS
ncbi:hypothetical protein RMB03_14805 [Acinetobacter sp. V91_7]|uniref:hypothetical protein n=1 Tax=unclassified Acinetobacter TaxID=196816 RepID=UPI00287F1350|nr:MULTISPECIES: hypothetical protein [unclassified Acinetobacter]MDS7934809.1 hypothetical protein [Acinetobacter sp. V91_4B]MDS7964224.1 hypothetical protein [Acinetobacter sp. V91_7]MDS8026614.1 hypothetical protein [Acinetobacter sp. V91_13]